MNIATANTRAGRNFRVFHTRFNQTLKIAACSLEHLRREVDHPGGAQVLNGILRGTDEPWNLDTMWHAPLPLIDEALREESLFGIAYAFSAFDQYLTRCDADLQSWLLIASGADAKKATPLPQSGNDEDDERSGRLKPFIEKVHFTGDLTSRAPMEHYLRLVRNCAVHREGRASAALVTYSQSAELLKCHSAWSSDPSRPLPPLPPMKVGEHIDVRPRHAILAMNTYFDIVRALDTHVVKLLGADGLVCLAARDAIRDGRFAESNGAYKSPQAVVSLALTQIHHVSLSRSDTLPAILRRLGIWEQCLRAHGEKRTLRGVLSGQNTRRQALQATAAGSDNGAAGRRSGAHRSGLPAAAR